jgi:hypothetical protein
MLTWSFGCAVRQHLVHVHVVGGAGAGLERVDDELVAVLAGEHLVGRPHDGVGEAGLETSRFLVRQRSRALDPDLRNDEGLEGPKSADGEIAARALGLNAV